MKSRMCYIPGKGIRKNYQRKPQTIHVAQKKDRAGTDYPNLEYGPMSEAQLVCLPLKWLTNNPIWVKKITLN